MCRRSALDDDRVLGNSIVVEEVNIEIPDLLVSNQGAHGGKEIGKTVIGTARVIILQVDNFVEQPFGSVLYILVPRIV